MKFGARLGLLVVTLCAVLVAGLASSARADTSPSTRQATTCIPTVWRVGCTTPVSLRGLLQLLDSRAATEPSLRFLATHFVVWADGCQTSLGSWAKAEGLGAASQMVALQRAAGQESSLVLAWLSDFDLFRQSDVTVTLVDSFGVPLESWQLLHVLPTHWTVVFLGTAAKLATETLDLSYDGLTPASPC